MWEKSTAKAGFGLLLIPTDLDRTAMADPVFTTTSALSLAAIFGALPLAYIGLVKLLPKTASKTDRITFVWLVGDLNLIRTVNI